MGDGNEDCDRNVGSLGCRRGGNSDSDGAACCESDVGALIRRSLEHGRPVDVRALNRRAFEDAGSAAVVVCADQHAAVEGLASRYCDVAGGSKEASAYAV